MIKHIFCDLDGTLLKDFYKIADEDINALKFAQNKGIKISIATGRLDYEIKSLMEKYQFNGFRISQNGAVVFDEGDNLIHVKHLSYEDVLLILNVLKGFNILLFFQTENAYIVKEKVKLIVDFEKTQPFITYIENKNIYNELDQFKFVSISLWAEKDHNIEIKKHLDKILPTHLTSYISSKYTVDITSKHNSKGDGITHLCNKYGIHFDEIAVIGDSQNDISMFNITKNSFVMSEANDDTKKHANTVVDQVKDVVYALVK